jgi:hypothetical protein
MVWAPVVLLAVTALLTITAWRFSRKSRRLLAEPRIDRVDRWLIEHYQLTSLRDCSDVRDAVREGRAVGDPALKQAAHGLAAELLSGRLRDPDPAALALAGLNVLGGVLYLATALAHGGRRSLLAIFLAATWLVAACAWFWGSRRLPRHKAEQALRLNKSDMDCSAGLRPSG